MIARYWLLYQKDPKALTSQEVRRLGIHKLRLISLGRCTAEQAVERARHKFASQQVPTEPASVIAHNVRVCMDSGNLARWGVTREQADLLRAGHAIEIVDSLGTFSVAWTPT